MPKITEAELDEFDKKLGVRIQALRINNGLSAEELSKRANVSAIYLGQYERGTRSPSVGALHRICTALGVKMSDMVR